MPVASSRRSRPSLSARNDALANIAIMRGGRHGDARSVGLAGPDRGQWASQRSNADAARVAYSQAASAEHLLRPTLSELAHAVNDLLVALGAGLGRFAALTAIFGKVGVANISADLATLVRTVVILATLAGIVGATGQWQAPASISGRTWLFLALSGLATGASWLCYFRALKLGDAARSRRSTS